MQAWVEITTALIQDRIRERENEAASERLAAIARNAGLLSFDGGVRRRVGRFLIVAGRRVAGEPGSSGSSAARPAAPIAA